MNDKELKDIILKEMHTMGKTPYDMHDLKKDKTLMIDLEDEMWKDDEGRMAKSNLYKAAKACTMLHNMLQDDEQLEGWVQEKIAIASNMLQTVANYLEYEKVSGK